MAASACPEIKDTISINEQGLLEVKKVDGLGDTVAKHYNNLQEAGIEARVQSRIFYLRNFNNWIKSVLISEYVKKAKEESQSEQIKVLDLCSGKGGDLLKWKKGNIDHLVCVDIAETSVEQSDSRYREMLTRNNKERRPQKMFIAEFHTADCTKVRLKSLYKDPDIKFTLVSCQFSFHYSFETAHQADMMLRNASECLKPGGYFIGTTPDSYEIVKRLRASESSSFGNEVYRVDYLSEDKENIPIFGAKYSFHLEGVVDCPEFVVYFPALEKMGEKYGLKLVCRKNFSQFFEENIKDHNHRGLIGRMQALEPYPNDEDVSLMSSDSSQYEKAAKKFEELKSDDPDKKRLKVGTLSNSEWEAATLYVVFAFQKVKIDGQPT